MLDRKQLIEKAYDLPYEEIKDYLNFEGWCFVSSIVRDFPDYEISKEDNDFMYSNGNRFRPKMMRGIENNNNWSMTGYHDPNVKNCPLKDGEYYHIGFLNYNGTFSYQGIRQFNEGFMDDDGYYLKPFPTHYMHIEKPEGAVYS